MCGRFTQRSSGRRITERFDIDHALFTAPPRYNIAPSQRIGVITADSSGSRTLRPAVWGLVPRWARGESSAGIINARAESVAAKPSFRDAFAKRRCLVPADGFFEWRRDPGDPRRKTPIFIHFADDAPFAFAGLFEPPDSDASPPTVAIITTTPNKLLEPIHNRMPVILTPDAERAWLDAGAVDIKAERPAVDALLALLRPYDPSLMAAHPVSRRVNSPADDDPHLIDPVDEAPDTQGGLFE